MAGMSSLVWFVFFFWLVVLISGPTTSVLSFQNHHHHHQCSWRSTRSIQSECRWKGRHSSSASSSWVLRASSSTTKAQQPNTETAAGSFFLEPSSAKKSSRAGSDGYSVLRQPATWEKDVDPTFDVPEWLLEESDDSSSSSNNNFYTNKDDEAWWTSQKQQQSRGTNNNNKASTTTTDTTPNEQHQAEQSLDLLQRSFDTLDFPRILQALYRECTTVPAKRLVQTAMQHQQQLHQPHESGGSSSSSGPRSNGSQNTTNTIETWVSVAHAPLLAETVEQSQDRYQAVQEMDCLLQGRIRSSDSHTDTAVAAQFRNRLGQYEPLFHRPPPFGNNNGFPWERIAEYAVAQSRVLDGPDLAGVADMLNAMENLVLWNRGLIAWTKQQQQQLSSQPTTTTAAAASTVPTTKDDFQFEQLSRIASCISINSTLQDLLNNAFETSTSNSGGGSDSGGRLSGTTFPTVGRLRSEIRLLKADIIQTLDGLLALPSMQSKLSLESGGPIYSEVQGSGRLVVPVDRKYASTMTLGIVHDTSRSGKTVYVEPNEIIAPTNELKQAEAKLRAEEARIWRFLTEQILVNRVEIETSVAAIGQLDLIMARLKLGEKISGTVPIVKDEGVILLRNAKHPVLVLRGLDAVIGSDIDLGRESNQGLVLTGPNAGGS